MGHKESNQTNKTKVKNLVAASQCYIQICVMTRCVITELFCIYILFSNPYIINIVSYMSAHVLLNLFNKLRKRDKM